MQDQCNDSAAEVQSKLRCASSLVLDLLLPQAEVSRICRELGYSFRDRLFNPMVVVWMFVSQVLSADHSCQQAVTRFNAWRVARGLARVSSETTSYRKARGKLPEQLFERLLAWTSKRCDEATNGAWLFKGRLVEMVDGWTVTMADTKENQQQYPQMKSQKPGCGFPIARMIGVFSLATGSIQFNVLAPYRRKANW
ncbi:hypothetical protein [Roseimaritima multifibrata]|uniref:hypothetical protein n=1 Tax=Roseimaritima multifibrata TaxID=1930274 RepID=UPI001FED252D|nr:hypothetical protein [Roseimaritima multifibrata]